MFVITFRGKEKIKVYIIVSDMFTDCFLLKNMHGLFISFNRIKKTS